MVLRQKTFLNVHDWVKRLEMVAKVRGIDELKLFKIDKFNLRGKSKEWFFVVLMNYHAMKATMLLKYGTIDKEKVRANLDSIKQEPKQRV